MRTGFLGAMVALACSVVTAGWEASAQDAAYEPVLNDDGLYTQEWFLESFLELRDDLVEAGSNGKSFAIIWEQKGCPYCRELHLTNFADDDIRTYVRENFEVIQLNIWGAREVTDFDGAALSEKELARKLKIRFTPTVQFYTLPEGADDTWAGTVEEAARMPGYLRPDPFMAMFQYVHDGAYERMDFRRYLTEEWTRNPPTQ